MGCDKCEVQGLISIMELVCAGSAVLQGLVQDLLQVFEAQVPSQLAHTQPSVRRKHSADQTIPATQGWQGRAAAAVVALTELVYGASSAWHGTQQGQSIAKGNTQSCQSEEANTPTAAFGDLAASQSKEPSSPSVEHSMPDTNHHSKPGTIQHMSNDVSSSSSSSSGKERQGTDLRSSWSWQTGSSAVHGDTGVLEQIVKQALDEFSSVGVWALATHVDPDAAVSTSGPLTPQVCLSQHPCNGMQPLHLTFSIFPRETSWASNQPACIELLLGCLHSAASGGLQQCHSNGVHSILHDL